MKLSRILKRNTTLLFLILAAAVAIRFLYSLYQPNIIVTPDTYSYYELGKTILYKRSFSLLINDARTPLYPLFLNLSMLITNNLGAEFLSKEFFTGMKITVFIQTLLSLTTLILLYKIAKMISRKARFAYLFTLFVALNPQIFAWERVLLTETLGSFFLATITFIFIKLLRELKLTLAIILLSLFIVNFLLKPVFILLPVAVLPILPLCYRTRKACLFSLILAILFLSVPISYIGINYGRHGYKGVNHVVDINLLGKILQFNLSVKEAKEFNYYYKTITHYRAINGNPNPYRFLEYYDPRIYDETEKLNQLQAFNFRVIANNLLEYILKSTLQVPKALLEVSEIITPVSPPPSFYYFFFLFLFVFYKNLQYITLITLIAIPVALFLFLKKSSKDSASLVLIATICLYQLVFSVFSGYEDFGRLLIPSQPILYILSFYWLRRLIFYNSTR